MAKYEYKIIGQNGDYKVQKRRFPFLPWETLQSGDCWNGIEDIVFPKKVWAEEFILEQEKIDNTID